MNHKDWQDHNGHPPAGLLLLHIDGELEKSVADTVRLHVSECVACQAECKQLESGMSHFVTFRDSVILPNPSPHATSLKQRLLEIRVESPRVSFISQLRNLIRFHSPRHAALAIGSAFVCLVICLIVVLRAPVQTVYASRILDDALHASDSLASHSKVLNQRVRVQRGNLIIERNVHRGRSAVHEAEQTRQPAIDPQFQQALDLAHINLNDPLSASDFAIWRAGAGPHADRVNGTPQSLTITTDVRGAKVTEASLTLSRSGWRPIARSVEFEGEEPIEISEESYDISDSPSTSSESAIVPHLPAAISAPKSTASPAEASITELERSELDLREAFHSIGADVAAEPQIWISEKTILYSADLADPVLRQQIEQVASRIAFVREASNQAKPDSEGKEPLLMSNPYPANASPAGVLANRFGNQQASSEFLESLRMRYIHTIAKADALDLLGKRYTTETMQDLPPDLQSRVNRLASSLLSSLQRDAVDYLKSLSPALDDFASHENILASEEDTSNTSRCLHWQENAALAAPRLRDLAKSTSLLFVQNGTQEPDPPTRNKLISDSLADRSFLQHHLMSTCQLFGTH